MTDRTIPILLDPLDVLFFRDGRPFSAASRGEGGLPNPQILAGALTTALLAERGCRFKALQQELQIPGRNFADAVAATCGESARWIAQIEFRGPWLARVPRLPAKAATASPASPLPEILWPVPANLHAPKKGAEGNCRLLQPLGDKTCLPGWKATRHNQPNRRPLWIASGDRTEPASGFLTLRGMTQVLCGKLNEWKTDSALLIRSEQLFGFDNRTGIGVDFERLSAAESQIYAARFLSLRSNVAHPEATGERHYDIQFYGELVLPADAPPDLLAGIQTLAFGGEGRRVALRKAARASFPEVNVAANSQQRPCLYLTTPGLFAAQPASPYAAEPAWLHAQIVASAVSGAVAVSGWDLAKGGPKPNRFAAAAGSVYFFDQLPDALPGSLCDAESDRRAGWGHYLKGVWNDE